MFFNDEIRVVTGNKFDKIIQIVKDAIIQVFKNVPEIDGIIFRIGESDGVDVTGDFISDIIIQTPNDVARFLQRIIPTFEQYNKQLIFRTWTIGVHKVGDLIWNSDTYKESFDSIDSQNFIISLKHGEGDFFRFLELNSHFLKDNKHLKLLEIQSRREYEGFGQFPNFIGWEYEKLLRQLALCDTLIGINVWCQTGGWSRTRSFSFLKKSSFFNELNTYVVLAIFKKRISVEKAVSEFCPEKNQTQLLQLLHYSNDVIEGLLYEPEFAKQRLYFNRVRIPPLLYVFWHYVTLTGPIIEVFRFYVKEPEKSLQKAEAAFQKIKQMEILNKTLCLNYDHQYYQETFALFLDARKIIYKDNKLFYQAFWKKCETYSEKYPDAYQFSVKPSSRTTSVVLSLLIPIYIRKQKSYRWYDRFLFNYLTSKLYTLINPYFAHELPEFINKKAMPIEKLLR